MYPVYGLGKLEEALKIYRVKTTKDSIDFLLSDELPIVLVKSITIAKSQQV